MNKEIIESLELELNIPCFFIKKSKKADNYIIFSISETPRKFCDDEEDIINCLVTMNLFYKGNFIEVKNKIIKIMKKLGYTRKHTPNAYWEDSLGCYNQAFQFSKLIESGEVDE